MQAYHRFNQYCTITNSDIYATINFCCGEHIFLSPHGANFMSKNRIEANCAIVVNIRQFPEDSIMYDGTKQLFQRISLGK